MHGWAGALAAGATLSGLLLSLLVVVAPSVERPAAVEVHISRCSAPDDSASGILLGPQRVLTAEHLVDDASQIWVTLADGHRIDVVSGVGDDNDDLAVLQLAEAVAGAPDPPRRHPEAGDRGIYVGVGSGGDVPFEVLRWVNVNVQPVADGVEGRRRRGAALAAPVVRGDSGAGLVTHEGDLIGVVVSRSTSRDNRGWSVDITEVDPLLAGEGTPLLRQTC